MRFPILTSLAVLASACHVQAKAVFAHFMVGNTGRYSTATWRDDIRLAQEAHIDGFALNIAYGERMNAGSLENVFEVASEMGFKLIFSFDYAGGGPWPKDDVLNLLKKYATRPEYFKHSDETPLVSTFEGPEQAADWVDIKRSFPCFFMPDWSSKGAKRAAELAGGVADGLFNWAAWPWGNTNMDTYVDASYYQYLRVDENTSKPYMMPASPWFYTNLPGYEKNWLWRGDDLWHDRWIQIVYNQPDYVEIISWNDYGESHHIGPLRPNAMDAFVTGRAPFNFARDMPHDGWRMTLPFWIDYYKNGKATVTQEGIMGWFRTTPAATCSDGETSGNTASQLQLEFSPAEVMQDRIFFSAVLGSHADVTVNVGGTSQAGTWTSVPDGGIGVYHGSVPFQGRGSVTISLQRGGANIATIDGGSITDNCAERGLTNWNAWVGSAMAAGSISATPALSRDEQKCIKGTGATGFTKLCEFTCKYGYCPVSACQCLAIGAPIPEPPTTGPAGFPAADACRLDYPIDEGDRCDVRDNTWREWTMPAIQHARYPMPPTNVHYITIVNLTPYTFRYMKDRSNYYQIAADFDDIPPGQSRQNKARWATSGSSRADDNGEAYFEVAGTNHEFRIRCTTHYPADRPIRFVVDLDGWGLGVKEYEVPETEVSITIGKYKWGGTSMDTQTQAYSIAGQLALGARYFDLRPALADGEFHIFHVSDPRATVIVGASGVTLQDVIDDINEFYARNPGEVIFLWMRDMVSFRGGLFGGGHPFDGNEMAQFFDKLRGIQNRCRGLTEATRFQDRVMGELMEQNDGRGCVAIILDQFGVDARVPQDDPASGIFLAGKHMDRTDRWEEGVGRSPGELLAYQATGFYDAERRRAEPSNGGDFFVSQWVLNAKHEDAVFYGLENLANYLTTPLLYYGGVAAMTPEMFPTVMLMDYIGMRVSGEHNENNLAAELRTLALGLNLYMASENCYVSKRRNPLVKKSNKKLAAPWNGIIFANGTRIDNPPPNFDPWRVDVLKSGTVFGNGTVLTRNITNPF
ncbi:Mutanase [Colletotrichum sp. SAR 10_65]|nr:Mutanase [Colletotrichum sp. SAR 10_65]KAI8255179.1 Mutanase [Colletotrichum sp. SAR 10_77]